MGRIIAQIVGYVLYYTVGVFAGGSLLIWCWQPFSITTERAEKMTYAETAKAEADAMSGLGGQYVKLWGDDGVKAKGIRFIVPGKIRQVKSARYAEKRQFETRIIVLTGEVMTRGNEVEKIDTPRSMMWSFSTQVAKQYKAAMKAHEGQNVPVLELVPSALQVSMEPWTIVAVVEGMSEADAGELVKSTDWADE